jgi:hypothetical protein
LTATTFNALQARKNELILKALEGSVFIAPATATLPTFLTTGASGALSTLPVGYTDVGYCDDKQGATWTRKPTTADVTAWGALEAVRTDITKDERTVKFTALETKALTIGLAEGLDVSGLVPDAVTKEVSFASETRPETVYYRVFGLFVDGSAGHEIYVARLLPRALVTSIGDEVWTNTGDPVTRAIEMAARVDTTAGFAVKTFFGGPGWQTILSELGFASGS